jgi:hypothetical protein
MMIDAWNPAYLHGDTSFFIFPANTGLIMVFSSQRSSGRTIRANWAYSSLLFPIQFL